MGDRVNASIIIGGALPHHLLEDFLDTIEAEGVGPDWDDIFEDRKALEAHIRRGDAGVAFYADRVLNGEFDALQAFCAQYGLAYKLSYDGYTGSWSPATRILGLDGLETSCSLDGDEGPPCVSLEDIQALRLADLDAVKAYLLCFQDYQSPPLVIGPA